jgi:hypothetical protein
VADVLHVAIVGGSETARMLITDFLSRPFVNLVGVADSDESSPGALAATRAGIPFTTEVTEFGDLDPQPDLVIDVCGDQALDPGVRTALVDAESGAPAIVGDVVARLVLGLAADSHALPPGCTDSTLPPALQS